jgi:hypothetical protein
MKRPIRRRAGYVRLVDPCRFAPSRGMPGRTY